MLTAEPEARLPAAAAAERADVRADLLAAWCGVRHVARRPRDHVPARGVGVHGRISQSPQKGIGQRGVAHRSAELRGVGDTIPPWPSTTLSVAATRAVRRAIAKSRE